MYLLLIKVLLKKKTPVFSINSFTRSNSEELIKQLTV
jgi:hypothetical protein